MGYFFWGTYRDHQSDQCFRLSTPFEMLMIFDLLLFNYKQRAVYLNWIIHTPAILKPAGLSMPGDVFWFIGSLSEPIGSDSD